MADKRKAILIRLPVELWEQLNRWAADELRSVNAQIEYVLRNAARKRMGDRGDTAPPEPTDDGSADAPPPADKKGPLPGA